MRTLTALLLSGVALCALNAQAELEFFVVEKDTAWTTDGESYKFRMRDSALAPTGLRVQRLAAAANYSLSAPITNPVSGSTGANLYGVYSESLVQEVGYRGTVMGDDGTGFGYPAGEGCVATYVDSTENSWMGWLRAFSHTTITGAAYFCDTEDRQLDTLDEFNDAWASWSFHITNVNPAYSIPLTGSWPDGGGEVSNASDSISFNGSVRQGSDFNNTLPDAIVSVHWSNEATGHSGTFAVDDAPGEWSGTISLDYANDPADDPITNVLTFYAKAPSSRSDLPVSDITTVTVVNYPIPEPAVGAVLLGALLAGLRRRG